MPNPKTQQTITSFEGVILWLFQEKKELKVMFYDIWKACQEHCEDNANQEFIAKNDKEFNRQLFFAILDLEKKEWLNKWMKENPKGDGQLISHVTITDKGKYHLSNNHYITLADARWNQLAAEGRDALNASPNNSPLERGRGVLSQNQQVTPQPLSATSPCGTSSTAKLSADKVTQSSAPDDCGGAEDINSDIPMKGGKIDITAMLQQIKDAPELEGYEQPKRSGTKLREQLTNHKSHANA